MSESELLTCVEVDPAGPARASVVWLHGLGADGNDFVPMVPHLGLDDAGAAGNRVRLEEIALPPTGDRAEILEGDIDEAVATLVERLREKGGL